MQTETDEPIPEPCVYGVLVDGVYVWLCAEHSREAKRVDVVKGERMATTITGLSEEELVKIRQAIGFIENNCFCLREMLGLLPNPPGQPAPRKLNPNAVCKVCEIPRRDHDDVMKTVAQSHKFVLLRKRTPQFPSSAAGMGLGGTA